MSNRTATATKDRSAKSTNGSPKAAPRERDRTRDRDEDMSNKQYLKELKKLQGELVKLQLWTKHTGAKIVVLFEGRDAAGKGGVIKAITERTSPRVFRIAALPAPTERQRSQMYIQ